MSPLNHWKVFVTSRFIRKIQLSIFPHRVHTVLTRKVWLEEAMPQRGERLQKRYANGFSGQQGNEWSAFAPFTLYSGTDWFIMGRRTHQKGQLMVQSHLWQGSWNQLLLCVCFHRLGRQKRRERERVREKDGVLSHLLLTSQMWIIWNQGPGTQSESPTLEAVVQGLKSSPATC